MEKRLVKTAKQQFEERLRELTLIKKFQLTESDFYFLCENEHHEMSILRKIHDEEFYEYKYDTSYRDLIESEEFLHEMTDRFKEGELLIKPLFEWYASADKDNEPFTLDDIWMCDLELTDHTVSFTDIYEDASGVRVITAREQWEKDTEKLITVRNNDGKVLLVNITVSDVKFYDNYDGYACYTYPPMEEMRKDALFVSRVVDELMRSANHDKIGEFMEWVREGGDFPLNPAVIYESEYQGFSFMRYKDKAESAEVEEMLRLTPEQNEALGAIENGFRAFYDAGGQIAYYNQDEEFFAVNGKGLDIVSDNGDYEKVLQKGFKDVSDFVAKQKADIKFSLWWATDGCVFARKK